MNKQDRANLNAISQAIFDKKGVNILALDVRGLSSMTDYFIIAEGSVNRHVKALCREIKSKAQEAGLSLFHIEGDNEGDWIVIDCGDIVIHLFTPEMREKYAFEEVWKNASIVDVEIIVPDVSQKSMDELRRTC